MVLVESVWLQIVRFGFVGHFLDEFALLDNIGKFVFVFFFLLYFFLYFILSFILIRMLSRNPRDREKKKEQDTQKEEEFNAAILAQIQSISLFKKQK